MAEMLVGLRYLHDKGVLHRDLKPSNVLIGASGHIKLADFGLATSTSRCKACGTLPYIAPEVLTNASSAATTAVDLWSMGCVLFELAMGERPFPCPEDQLPLKMLATLMATVREDAPESNTPGGSEPQHQHARPPAPHDHLSAATTDLVERLLAIDPAVRLGAACFGELQSHRFFDGVKWDALLEVMPPFVPHLKGSADDGYFPTFNAFGEKMLGRPPSFNLDSNRSSNIVLGGAEASAGAAGAERHAVPDDGPKQLRTLPVVAAARFEAPPTSFEAPATSWSPTAVRFGDVQQVGHGPRSKAPSSTGKGSKYGQLAGGGRAQPHARPNYGQLAPNAGKLTAPPKPILSMAHVPRVNVDELLALTKASVGECHRQAAPSQEPPAVTKD